MNINCKKSLKFVTLVITAMLIATVSAEAYRYMYIEGTITVGGIKLMWIQGSDVPGATIIGGTATISLNVENNTAVNFTEALFLKNNDTTTAYDYNITVLQPLAGTDFEIAKLHIYENNTTPGTWTYLSSVDLTSSSSNYQSTLAPGNYTRITIEVKAIKDSISESFKVQLEYWP
ncbi:hypothetical protein MUO83_05950 [Candidatus Bathyarchaeota archaeon]|jgi:hypothetical protein|nr:hypothetical protein [Candidatus Bathyarchaeota archaeon]